MHKVLEKLGNFQNFKKRKNNETGYISNTP